MYESYFGLTERPFSIAPDPQYLYMSTRHKEAMAHLTYGLSQGGCFIVLTGEVGTGKTTLCRNLLGQLPDNVDVALILNANINETELLQTICDERKIPYQQDATQKQLLDLIYNYLLQTFSETRHTVLIIDEAQMLSRDVLEQIRLLTNLETNKSKLLQIILIGQPELNDLLSRTDLRQLAQRVTARYHLGALERSEIEEYVNYRLGVAGCKKPIFSKQALTKLHAVTEGIPRKINVLADHALLAAYSKSQGLVDVKIIKAASNDVFINNAPKGEHTNSVKWLLRWWPVLAVAVVLNISLWWWFADNSKTQLTGTAIQNTIVAQDQSQAEFIGGAQSPMLEIPSEVESQATLNPQAIGEDMPVAVNSVELAATQLEPTSSATGSQGSMLVSDEILDDSVEPELTLASAVVAIPNIEQADALTTESNGGSNAIATPPSLSQSMPFAASELGLLLETSADVTGRISAFRNLAGLWKEELPAQMIQPACEILAQSGLLCLGFNSWEQMLRYNRPAIFVLNQGNQLHRVIVSAIDQDQAELIVNERRLSVPVAELRARWNENGVLFWRPTASLLGLYQKGDRGPAIRQVKTLLNAALAAANMPTLENPDSTDFDIDVSQKVFALQTRFGIIGDSRIGNETKMLMNELNMPDATPVLTKRVP